MPIAGVLAEAMRRHHALRIAAPREVVWHYCPGDTLRAIVRSGAIMPTAGKDAGRAPHDRPAVWFTLRRDWDPAVAMGGFAPPSSDVERALRRGGVSEVMKLAPVVQPGEVGGLGRIGVSPSVAPMTWPEFIRSGHIDPAFAKITETLDREAGSNPDDWRVSLDPVPASKWIAVEVRSGERKGERWEPLPARGRRMSHGG